MKRFAIFLLLSLLPSMALAAGLTDTFTGSTNTNLAAHTSDSSHTWSTSAGTAGGVKLTGSNAIKAVASATNVEVCVASWTPVSADYESQCSIYIAAESADTGVQAGVGVRAGASAFTGYFALLVGSNSGAQLRLYRAGNATPLGTSNQAVSSGNTYSLTLSAVGNVVTVWWQGAVVIQVTATGADIIGDVGLAAVYMQYRTADYQNISALSTADLTTDTVNTDDLWDNGYNNVDAPRQSCTAWVRFTTNASSVLVTGTTTMYASYPTYSHLGVRIDGVDQSPLAFAANGQRAFNVVLGTAGTSRVVEVVAGVQSELSGTVIGSFIDSVTYSANQSFVMATPTTGARILIYGDSIASGGNAENPEYAGVGPLLRNTYTRRIMLESWGYRTLYDDCVDASARTTFTARVAGYAPSAVWLEIGTNDYGLEAWSAADFGTAYADLLDKLHAALPSAAIFCQSPLDRTTETANAFGDTLGDYRTQISTACSARSWSTFVDGTAILETSDLADGVHPTTAGHALYAAYVDTLLASGTYALTAPTPASGKINVASGNFTAALDTGQYPVSIVITPASDVAGTFTPETVTLTDTTRSGTFTFTPTAAGTATITTTNDGSMTDPSGVAYEVTASGGGGIIGGGLLSASNRQPTYQLSP